jgi:hypothetical protein
MPYGDRTGPKGFGPLTGRQAGFCAGYAVPGYANFARDWACSGGGSRGWRNQYYKTGLKGWQRAATGWVDTMMPFGAPISRDVELARLKAQAENLTRTLDGIKRQIETIEAQGRKDA